MGLFRRFAPFVLATALFGCANAAFDKQTGLVTIQPGAKGGMVMGPNGLEFHDNADIPQPVVFHTVDEPWHAPIGFILPKSGRFTHTSTATTIASQGIAIVLRPSDTRVPAWGGEVLLRVDVHATAAPGSTRKGERVAIVLDGDGDEMVAAFDAALGQLGGDDILTVIDARGARVLVPTIPATHRALALAATAERATFSGARDLSAALAKALVATKGQGTRRTLLLSTKPDVVSAATEAHAKSGVAFVRVDPRLPDAATTIQTFLPASGPVVFRDLTLTFDGTPAPSRVLESTTGDPLWTLDGSELSFGDIRAGSARSDVLRVTVPAWVPNKRFALHVTARAVDQLGKARVFPAELAYVYDDDLERIADSRHGDVIAYASALATMHRLHAAFVGDAIGAHGGLRQIAQLQAQSLALLARDFPDRGFAEDAVVLQAILQASQP